MKLDAFPSAVKDGLVPVVSGDLRYHCLGCERLFDIRRLLYTCPQCGQVLLLEDQDFDRLRQVQGETWRRIFDYRKMLTQPAIKGIFRYHEFIGPVIPLEAIVYLGEGHTPIVEANAHLQQMAGLPFFFKNDGQNPSASFKDRGMASALSYLNYLVRSELVDDVLAICASTGDTSAAAALYAAYLQPQIKSAVLLPHQKVTVQQLAQPLGSGAAVFEIPGVFDDCMKVVEYLSENFNVALLNSKNAWRILGQESYSYEIAQDFEYDVGHLAVVVPIGNAGNITAVMNGFLKFHAAGVIDALPKIIGVQSEHANPVYRYYRKPDGQRQFEPVTVKPSVAQAAMIGNPVSMPRVIHLEAKYNRIAGGERVFVVEVSEQDIMDWHLKANRNGHIACTHGGECLAGLLAARRRGLVDDDEVAILDATAHALKFVGFQETYFADDFNEAFNIEAKSELINMPRLILPDDPEQIPRQGSPLTGRHFEQFVHQVAASIARHLKLEANQS
jgi:threonine synthase